MVFVFRYGFGIDFVFWMRVVYWVVSIRVVYVKFV